MLVKNDQVIIAVKLVSDEDINGLHVARFLELMTIFFHLAIAIMSVVMSVINALDAWAASFWRVWDVAWVGLWWHLCPVRVVPLG
jgi:hypothetical protein